MQNGFLHRTLDQIMPTSGLCRVNGSRVFLPALTAGSVAINRRVPLSFRGPCPNATTDAASTSRTSTGNSRMLFVGRFWRTRRSLAPSCGRLPTSRVRAHRPNNHPSGCGKSSGRSVPSWRDDRDCGRQHLVRRAPAAGRQSHYPSIDRCKLGTFEGRCLPRGTSGSP